MAVLPAQKKKLASALRGIADRLHKEAEQVVNIRVNVDAAEANATMAMLRAHIKALRREMAGLGNFIPRMEVAKTKKGK